MSDEEKYKGLFHPSTFIPHRSLGYPIGFDLQRLGLLRRIVRLEGNLKQMLTRPSLRAS